MAEVDAYPDGRHRPAELAGELRDMIDHSYELVVAGLTRAQRARLAGGGGDGPGGRSRP